MEGLVLEMRWDAPELAHGTRGFAVPLAQLAASPPAWLGCNLAGSLSLHCRQRGNMLQPQPGCGGCSWDAND